MNELSHEQGLASVGDDSCQYLTFIVDDEEYGVDILRVQEIRGWGPCTVLPNAPDYVCGVINLRGTVVPIIDLRRRFGIEPLDYGPTTVVIVLRIAGDKKNKIMGIVVDAVSDVHTIARDCLQATPDLGGDTNMSFIVGLADIQGHMIILLNTDELLNIEHMPDMQHVKQQLAAAQTNTSEA